MESDSALGERNGFKSESLFNIDCLLPGDNTAAAGELPEEAIVTDTPKKC
jgi:hypothetical protein